ncbi:N-6 DNA methylase [Euryhalocaulis caribicus]|uniref:N-6 DNA methylase n=1 Tax=Euryhalocaulis caribicus TaxID=1161401 RepID=UPI00047D2230|nr:N-6 DNA methylase [Euryhalocaulis caribicus]
MSSDLGQAREAIVRCRGLRQKAVVEAVLRGEFQSRLRRIFPDSDDEGWINHYGEGAEAHTKVGTKTGKAADRFIDNLIGSTTIEYEADLRNKAKRDEGFNQVKEHAAGLIRAGAKDSQVRGILSDTVEWYAYDVALRAGVDPASCTIDDIHLTEVENFTETSDDEQAAERLTLFLRRHLAREQSRPLIAENLSFDLGLESPAYRRNVKVLTELVDAGRKSDPSISLATDLWSHFVDHLEGAGGGFRTEPYVDEIYLNILARLLSANALASSAIVSADDELQAILNGAYFRDRYQLGNLVEQDYFGWIARTAHIGGFLSVAREIQRDLYAYDFSRRAEEDLFGRLMAQLARRSQRKLLGQEWTPGWLSRHLAERCLDLLPEGEAPAIVDMCCGSGAILAEVIKAARDRYGYAEITALHEVVTGFDIDPLAVALSKTTWVITLAAEINAAAAPVTIPVYHADSLFAVTPVSASIPMLGEGDVIDITLDGETIALPAGLVHPDYRELFDRIIDWAYDEARDKGAPALTEDDAAATLDTAVAASVVSLPAELRQAAITAVLALANRMKELAAAGRNGIWAFILRNTYRPGLLAGQFNGLVSNPPWLAMSALADNPYREVLSRRAALYGVKPAGQSFLHLELGTTHLLHAVDRYLAPGAAVACLVPGTIFNGTHHERFRQRAYLTSPRPVPLCVSEVWQVAPGTFKYPGAALIGHKESDPGAADTAPQRGFVARQDGPEAADFSIRRIGTTRTAWALEKGGMPAAPAGSEEVSQQGADIMPRGAVCVEILNNSGNEFRVDTPTRDTTWGFTVKQVKELAGERFPGHVAPRFIHLMAQSENLLPFVLGDDRAPVAIPASRDAAGAWQIYEPAEIRRMGFTNTARRFTAINARLASVGAGNTLEYRINVRNKLTNQQFGDAGCLVLSGAGGKHICAACLPLTEANALVIDQTLYWQVVPDEHEAWFRTGVLNSSALTDAILPFNPEGDFGPRHIHTLPYRLMPAFDPFNEDHQRIAELARQLAAIAAAAVAGDAYLGDPNRSLPVRRRKMREALAATDEKKKLEKLCAALLGTSAPQDEPEAAGADGA